QDRKRSAPRSPRSARRCAAPISRRSTRTFLRKCSICSASSDKASFRGVRKIVNRDNQTWIGARFAQLSTGLKMLLILSFGLFPLGLIAVVASIDSARQNMADRRDDTFTRLEIKAQRINAALDRSAITIGAASAAIDSTEAGSGVCRRTLGRLGRSNARYALFAD